MPFFLLLRLPRICASVNPERCLLEGQGPGARASWCTPFKRSSKSANNRGAELFLLKQIAPLQVHKRWEREESKGASPAHAYCSHSSPCGDLRHASPGAPPPTQRTARVSSPSEVLPRTWPSTRHPLSSVTFLELV